MAIPSTLPPASTDEVGLRPPSALDLLDRALAVLRLGEFSRVAWCWFSGAPLALTVLAIHYLERVEGVHGLRPGFAVALVFSFWIRAVVLGRVARVLALDFRPALSMPDGAGKPVDVLCTASVAAFGAWVWLWPMAALARLSPFALVVLVPALALRGALAPSWIARASCARERGLRAFARAFGDTAGVRSIMYLVELLLLVGAAGLFANLYALLSLSLLLARSMLGLDVAFVAAFSSLDNTLVLLFLLVLTLLLVEPLRAALSAQVFSEARARKDGADLHAAIEALHPAGAEETGTPFGSSPRGAVRAKARLTRLSIVVLACSSGVAWALPLRAEPLVSKNAPARTAAVPAPARDALVRERLGRILEGHEFSEFDTDDGRSLGKWLGKYFDRLLGSQPEPRQVDGAHRPSLSSLSPWLVMSLALFVLLMLLLHVSTYERRTPPRASVSTDGERLRSERGREPGQLFDAATVLAGQGRLRDALRALYVATLVALDRERVIRFDPAKTNGQYLRAMPDGELREQLEAFTLVFDEKWYGHAETSLEDYTRCRALVDRIRAARGAA